MIATIQKNVAFHAVRCVNLLVALIGKIMSSVHGWILTGFAKTRLACAIGVNVGMRMTNGIVNGMG